MNANKFNFNPEQLFNPEAFKPFLNAGGLNLEEAMAGQKHNMEAMAAASKEAVEAARNLAECQVNYAREQMESASNFWRNWISSGPNLQDKAEIQNQAARESLAKAMAHSKEVTAIVQKTQEKCLRAFGENLSTANTNAANAAKRAEKAAKPKK